MSSLINRIINKIQFEYQSKNWFKNESSKLKGFYNIHEGEDCFIIGNGPSLNKMNLSLLNDYYTFGLNKIFLIFKKVALDLSYHVAANSLVIKQSKNEIEKLKCPSFISVLPGKKAGIKSNDVFYINDCDVRTRFSKDITQGIVQGSTVTYIALQIAFYMGFKRVFLIGIDHNFDQRGNPHEEQKLQTDDVNHFDPNYFKGMSWHLADLEGSEVSYLIAKYYFEKADRLIYDATIDGNLEIFNKIDYNKAIELAKKKIISRC